MFPDADVPVAQLGIDETLAAGEHERLARRLAPLRDEGVLVFGSGNVVHNLHEYAWGRRAAAPFDWAVRFECVLRQRIAAGDLAGVVGYESLGADATLAAPTPEHFLPLIYVLAQHRPGDRVTFPVEGFDGGSVSMLGVRIGG
ncbi:MAG: dioxygenase family protein [Candidatus Polarisedimenticolia bacterium]